MIIHQVVREGYGTFQGDNGFHKSRIFLLLLFLYCFLYLEKKYKKAFFLLFCHLYPFLLDFALLRCFHQYIFIT